MRPDNTASISINKKRQSKAPTAAAKFAYLPALDGLRALAIIGVLLYHGDMPWMPGGFLGVEVFFVISGYLITSLLLAEWQHTGQVDLKAFWLRRARRLLPALFLTLAVTLVYAVLFLPGEVAGLRDDALAALGYATNWYLIFSQKSYFQIVGRPSLLRHLWSLAVEEQFYLLWPLLFAGGMWLLKRRRFLLAILTGAVVSSASMALLYRPDVDPSRIYYGTDTRAAGLLVGAALAFVWVPAQLGRGTSKLKVWLLDLVGLAALAGLVVFYARLDEFQPFLYQGGFAALALTTCVLIAATVHPRARLLPALLGQRVLGWFGTRSYGIYLWHWSIYMITRPQLDVMLEGVPLLCVRLAATFVVAELSYRLVESPVRQGALGRAWKAWRAAQGRLRWQLGAQWVGATGAILCFAVALGTSVAGAQPPAPPAYLSVSSVQTTPSLVMLPQAEPVESTPAPVETVATAAASANADTVTPTPEPTSSALVLGTPTPAAVAERTAMTETDDIDQPQRKVRLASVLAPEPTRSALSASQRITTTQPVSRVMGLRVTAIGDSVLLSAAPQLAEAMPGIGIDAVVGRQVAEAIELLRNYRAANQLGEVVIVHMGNNGGFTAKQLEDMMQILAGARQVLILNVKVPRAWEGPNNAMLANHVKTYANALLLDWHGVSSRRPELYWDDGIHLRPEGAQVYAALVAERIAAK